MGTPWSSRQKKRYSKTHGKRRTLETMGYRDLVKKLDRELSFFVRLSAADNGGIVMCVTCGSLHFWKDITLGHYISRSHHSTRWDLRNMAPQCVRCNSYHGGEQYKMRAYLVETHGEEEVKALEKKADQTKTETADSLRKQVIEYRAEVKRLKTEKELF